MCEPPSLLLPYVAALEAHRSITLLLSDGTILGVIALDWTCGNRCAPHRAPSLLIGGEINSQIAQAEESTAQEERKLRLVKEALERDMRTA